MSKYQKIPNYQGIRKDLKNGKYLAVKYINGKEFSKKFESLKEAIVWKNNFHPAIPDRVIENKIQSSMVDTMNLNFHRKLNGEDLGYYFRDVWSLYKEIYLPSIEKSSMDHRLAKENFYEPLFNFKMVEITATLLDRFIAEQKIEAIKSKSKRYNFKDDLKCLKAILNWYRENYDSLFVNPILKRHHQAGIIKKLVPKNKKMQAHELLNFFNALPEFWRDFAETQFYMGARVSEIAGLQVESVNFKDEEICIKHVAIWSYKTKKFEYLKEYPKNGEVSYASMNTRLKEILERRVLHSLNGFVFHKEGAPFSYRQIQYEYNKALAKAGLAKQFSSTHIMRHSMGTLTRKVTGSLDMAQAVTRHKDIQVAQQYANLPTEVNRKAVNDVCDYLQNFEANSRLNEVEKRRKAFQVIQSE
jgi:integrase